MRNELKSGTIFRSGDIEIKMQETSAPDGFPKSYITENAFSFNLFFILNSSVRVEALDGCTQFLFRKNQYILHYSSKKNSAELWSESQENLKYIQIQITDQYIQGLLKPELSREGEEIWNNMLHNQFIFLHKETPPDMTVEMHMILNEILHSTKKGIMQELFVEAKVIKLLILISEQFNEKDSLESAPKTTELIKEFIDENYHRNIKAEEIGKLIGINQNVIRKEFKAQYHTTIAHYISELRMLKAKKMITDKEIMIKEIAIECGYEYLQNFTRAFKKKFGVSPENLRNNT